MQSQKEAPLSQSSETVIQLQPCVCEFTCACSFSVLTLTACACRKRVLPVWKAPLALRSMTPGPHHQSCAITNIHISPFMMRDKIVEKGDFNAHLEHLLLKSSHCVNVCLKKKKRMTRFVSRKWDLKWDAWHKPYTSKTNSELSLWIDWRRILPLFAQTKRNYMYQW